MPPRTAKAKQMQLDARARAADARHLAALPAQPPPYPPPERPPPLRLLPRSPIVHMAASPPPGQPNVHIAAAPRSRLGAILNYTKRGRNAVGRAFRNLVTTASSLPAAAGRRVSNMRNWITRHWDRIQQQFSNHLNHYPVLNRFRTGAATRRLRRRARADGRAAFDAVMGDDDALRDVAASADRLPAAKAAMRAAVRAALGLPPRAPPPRGADSSRSINSPTAGRGARTPAPASARRSPSPTGGVSSANTERALMRVRFLREAGLPLNYDEYRHGGGS